MTGNLILSPFQALGSRLRAFFRPSQHSGTDLHAWWLHPELLPPLVSETPTIMRTLELLGPLDWGRFPERDLLRHWVQPAVSYAAFSAAMLVKLNEGLATIGTLRRHLVEHPGFIPLLGFRVVRSRRTRVALIRTPACPRNAIFPGCCVKCPIPACSFCWPTPCV